MIVSSSIGNRFLTAWAAMFLVSLALPGMGQEEPLVPPFADELPAAIGLCVWSDDARLLTDRWQGTALFQVYAADAMRPFWSDVRKKRGALLPTELLGLTWNEFAETSAGTWVLACSFRPESRGVLLVIDVRGQEKAALGHLEQCWQDRGMNVRTRPHPRGTLMEGEQDGSHRWALVDRGHLCVTDQLQLVTSQTTETPDATREPFSGTEMYRVLAAIKQVAPRGSVRFCVDPWQLARYAGDSRDAATANRLEFFERHGFDAIRAIAGHVDFGTESHDLEFVVRVPARSPLKDAARMLSFTSSKDFQFSPLVPRDAVGMACLHLDVGRVLKGYGSVFDDVYGEGYEGAFDDLLNSLAEDPDGPQVDLRTELLGTLTGKVDRVYDYRGPVAKGNSTGRRELWMAESQDPSRAARALERYYAHDPDVTSSSVNGAPIWHARTAGPLLGDDPENPLALRADALGVMQGHVVLATDRHWLQEVARAAGEAASTIERPQWQVSSPTAHVLQSWRDLPTVAGALHEAVRHNRLQLSTSWEEGLLWYLLSTDTEQGRQLAVDGAMLPPFSAIRDKFGWELVEADVDQHGWRLQGRLTRPKP